MVTKNLPLVEPSDEEATERLFARWRRIHDRTLGGGTINYEAAGKAAQFNPRATGAALEPLMFYAQVVTAISRLPERERIITKIYLAHRRGAGAALTELRKRGHQMGLRTFWRRVYGGEGSKRLALVEYWGKWARRHG